jgi:serine/threonine protein phosphatase PrpC
MLNREGETTIARKIDADWKRNVLKSNRSRRIKVNAEDKRILSEKSNEAIWKMYGTTLLGMLIAPTFVFAYQLGDGDIVFSSNNKAGHVIIGDLMLGTATHSLSSVDSWKRAKTNIYPAPNKDEACAFHISTDGFSNSYRDEQTFLATSLDYFKTLNEHGVDAVKSNIKAWLNETSKNGSGDDITVMLAYNPGK